MPLAQTVTVVNRSGKIVKTSKTLVDVLKEAKTTYLERRAEIKAVRKAGLDERDTRRALDRLDAEDSDEEYYHRAHSRRSSHSSVSTARRRSATSERPRPTRVHTDSSVRSDRSIPNSPRSPRSPRPHTPSRLRFEDALRDDVRPESHGKELVRRRTDGMLGEHASRPRSVRSASAEDVDASLAYGELPPPLPLRPNGETDELRNKVSKLQALLDEANCVQHTAIATIESLQKNPEKLAAVALTLAEISTLASKMAPAALTGMKGVFPAVFALLACPEFLIAAGVGVGVTIIALGGYKIIKKIRNKKDAADTPAIEDTTEDVDELQEIRSDLSRIEVWRRGIADAQSETAATSVDGEYITPRASRQLIEQGRMRESDLKSAKSSGKAKKRAKEHEKKRKDSHANEESVFDKGKALIKDPNGIRSLFKRESKRPEPSVI